MTIENLTVCNFLGHLSGNNGNQIWWNGGDGSGQIGMGAYSGSHLTASSTFYQQRTPSSAQPLAEYGIFASNSRGRARSPTRTRATCPTPPFYIGACADCNAVLNFVHAQNNAQGFSGSNAGGQLVVENSEWDLNQSGIVPSSLALTIRLRSRIAPVRMIGQVLHADRGQLRSRQTTTRTRRRPSWLPLPGPEQGSI